MQFADISLPHGLFLGPMAGYTDAAMRAVCRLHGAEFIVTEMVSAKALTYKDKKTAPLCTITEQELPCAVQLFGHEEDILREAAILVASGAYGTPPTSIDINMGCPVHKITANGEGAALMKTPDLAARLVHSVKKAVSLPVTVKMRIGWDEQHINAAEFAKAMEAAGCDLLSVHGRTKSQGYSGRASLSHIRAVKEAVSIPVVGNGDIRDVASALRMIDETGVDGIMIARGAVGNPFLFSQIAACLDGKGWHLPTREERYEAAHTQLSLAIAEKGEYTAVREAKKQMGEYLNGIPGAASARLRIHTQETKEGILRILRDHLFPFDDAPTLL